MINNDVLVYSFPLHKKLILFLASLFMAGLAYVLIISGTYLLIFLGSLIFGMVVFALYKILTISKVLTVTKEGLIPHSVMKRDAGYIIPWDNIKNIYVAKQRGRHISEVYLAIGLFDTESLDQNQTSTQNVLDTLNTTISGQMSDKSGGDIYVSVRMLSKSAKTIVDEINLFRSQHDIRSDTLSG